jgi:hypothetical protein
MRRESTARMRSAHAAAVLSAVLVLASPLHADLMPDDAQFKDHASVFDTPKFVSGLPSYFEAGNIVGSITDNLVWFGPPGHVFTGTITTTVYRNPDTGFLTFDYQIDASSRNTRNMVRGVIGGDFRVGADASGLSGTGDPGAEWSDGDPVSIGRGAYDVLAQPSFDFRLGALGTVLGPGDSSSHIWFETNATRYTVADADILDTFVRAEGKVLAPIPEPAAIVLGLMGLAMVGPLRRRSRVN